MTLSNLQIAITAAIDAGNVIMEVYETDFKVSSKDDQSPITLADEKANEMIMSHLEQTNIPIISEENKQVSYEVRKNWQRCWIVDPLDGTKEFVKRNGEFTVNIALIEEGAPILGVIYIPVTRMLYFTSDNCQSSHKIKISDFSHNAIEEILRNAKEIFPTLATDILKVVSSRSHFNAQTKSYLTRFAEDKEVHILHKGSSLKFCTIAEGKAQLYPRFAPTMEWDTAAGHAICRAVGVEVIDQETQNPLRYNKEQLLNPSFAVYTKA